MVLPNSFVKDKKKDEWPILDDASDNEGPKKIIPPPQQPSESRKKSEMRMYICFGVFFIVLLCVFATTNLSLLKELSNLEVNKKTQLQKEFPPDHCSNIPKEERFDCHPEDGASEKSCNDRGCCWNPINNQQYEKATKVPLNTPYCYYPPGWNLYKWWNYTQTRNDFDGFMGNVLHSVYKKDIQTIRMQASSVDKSILRVKIFDAERKRYEPKLPIRSDPQPFNPDQYSDSDKFQFEFNKIRPGFRVKRSVGETTIFDSTAAGGFIFADQLLQMSTLLPSSNIYGLGEHRTNFKLNTNWKSLTMFNKDQPPMVDSNLYGSQPFYFVIEKSGKCHGVLFLNSNAMDVILQPTPALTFRSIGGVFDMYFFMGPTPAEVLSQYSQIVGKPFMPPYWSLGFHLCRFGYGDLANTRKVWNRTRAAGIPFDTQWNDLDYMNNNNDFTYDTEKFKDLPGFLHELSEAGMHYIPLIDAGISASEINGTYRPFDEGLRRKIFIMEADSDLPFKGKVWNRKSTVWPDFTNPDSHKYMFDMMNDMWKMFPYDGAWLDMNEPSNFYNGHINGCVQNELDNPQYVPNVVGNVLATKTLCMNARHYLGTHYDVHNTYAMHEAIATNEALRKIRNKRPFIISRATWTGFGAYAGHWSGDNFSTWYDMRMSISQLLSFSLFQIPMMGSDICGFNDNTTQALCNRWMQLGAFYPFARNHNSDENIEQDPVAMGEQVVKSSRKALMIRYRFIPYLYTLFFRAHIFGETVARPLFFEFVDDPATYGVDTQFLWGKSLMILPVLEEGATKVTAYVPKGVWYDFYDKKSIISNGQNFTFDAPLDTIPLIIRGGSILPAQTPGNTTTASRRNNFELLIAPDVNGTATGELFLDDGENLVATDPANYRWWKFNLSEKKLYHMEVIPGKYSKGNMILGKVQVMGENSPISEVKLNGRSVNFTYDDKRSYLTVKHLQIDLRESFQLAWK